MTTAVTIVLCSIAIALLVPILVLTIECTAAALGRRPPTHDVTGRRPSVAVLVPAHDEEMVIETTIRSVLPQLGTSDRLLVVADNCTDNTTAVARAAGASVVERDEPGQRGKGHALAFGVTHLDRDPPEVVVILDADCTLHDQALEILARTAAATDRPVQARNVVPPRAGSGPLQHLSAFAFLIKNVVRPNGLSNLGMPCPLTGTGMAIPWSVLRSAPLASAALAEDLQLGSDLALGGHPPLYCHDALVTSPPPAQKAARESQRRRWEYGHLATLLSRGPRLLGAAVRRLRLPLLALALDLSVPPLSLMMLVWSGSFSAAIVAGALGASWYPAALLGAGGALVVLAISVAWIAFGRRDFPPSILLLAPFYIARKVPMYLGFLIRRQRRWVRTERDRDQRRGDQ